MRNLPEVFNVSPVVCVDECMSIVTSITPSSTTTHIDRYKLKAAKSYFMENLKIFSTEQVQEVLNHSCFKKFDGDFFKKAIEFSIQKQWVFPIVFNAWFDKKITDYDRLRYLSLLNKNNNKEQLRFFCEQKKFDLDSFFRNNEPSYYLSLFAQKKDSKYVFYNKTWSKQELTNWFNENKEQIPSFINDYFTAQNIISDQVQEIYSQFLSDFVISDEKKTKDKSWDRPFIQALCVMTAKFWEIVEEKSPGLIRDRISLPMQEKENKSYICNYGQKLMGNLLQNGGMKRVLDAFEPYLDIGLIPVKETISNSHYEITSDAFEVALRNNILYLFVPYAYNFDLLNEKQKEIMVAASFSWLIKDKKFIGFSDETYTLWAEKTLSIADTSITEKYFQLNKNDFNDETSLERTEILIRSKKLEEQLCEKTSIKRMKI